MPTARVMSFTAFDFTEEELKSAVVFNSLQKQYLQTQLAQIAQDILNLDCSTKEQREEFEIQRSFLKGQLTMCQFLIDGSSQMETVIVQEANDAHQRSTAVEVPGPNLYQYFTQSSQNSEE